MIGVYILCILIGLIISGIIAGKFSEIAEMKGHNGRPYFWFTFLFGVAGMLMVIALPHIRQEGNNPYNNKARSSGDEHIDIPVNEKNTQSKIESMYCSNCKKPITAYPCKHCGNSIERETAPYWCGKCGYLGPYADKCPKCSSSIKIYNINRK